MIETLRAFLLVRRSIDHAVHQAGALGGTPDADTWRLYDRIAAFMDAMLLATIDGFQQAETRALDATTPSSSSHR
jgi:hypothetical protein